MLSTALYSFISNTTVITDLIGSGISCRLYPGGAEQDESRPYIVYYVISDIEYHVLAGADGMSEARVQLECWAGTYLSAHQLADTVRKQLDGYLGYWDTVRIKKCFLDTQSDTVYEDAEKQEDKIYGVLCDYSIIYDKQKPYM